MTSSRPANLCNYLAQSTIVHLTGLTLVRGSGGPQTVVPPSTSPPLTGSLRIFTKNGIAGTARRLMDLPGGLHFREIRPGPSEEELPLVSGLVDASFDTLEYLHIVFCEISELGFIPQLISYALKFLKSVSTAEVAASPIDLSKATKLEEAAFWCYSERIEWVILALKTITPGHRNLRHISIRLHSSLPYFHLSVAPQLRLEAGNHDAQWSNLDLLLVHFWKSHYIRAKIVCPRSPPVSYTRGVRDLVPCLFPESMERGILDLVDEQLYESPVTI